MTAKKTPDSDPGIIEGVAVEKPEKRASRRGTGKGGDGKQSGGRAAETGPAGGSAAAGDDTPSKASAAGTELMTGLKLPLILGAAAILLALAGIAIQQWMAARLDSRLQAEMKTLVSQIDTANDALARVQADVVVIGTNQDAVAARLAGIESELPPDPAEALAALGMRLDRLEADLAAMPAGGNAAVPVQDAGIALAQAGLAAATAMTSANLDGGDPASWLPVLDELAAAGLEVGDIAAIEALLTPRPSSTARLLADGITLAEMVAAEARGASGWWQNTTGRIAGFIRLRRSDDAPAGEEARPESSLPLDAFMRALRGGSLAAALAASRQIDPPPAGFSGWQARAQRRIDLDAALAGLMAGMTAHLNAAGAVD